MTSEQFAALPEREQDLQLAEDALRDEACPECHGDLAECGDLERDWFPQRHICLRTAARKMAQRKYEALHKELPYHDGTFAQWSKEPTDATPFHFSDGVTVYVADSDINPDDDFLTKGGGVLGGRASRERPTGPGDELPAEGR